MTCCDLSQDCSIKFNQVNPSHYEMIFSCFQCCIITVTAQYSHRNIYLISSLICTAVLTRSHGKVSCKAVKLMFSFPLRLLVRVNGWNQTKQESRAATSLLLLVETTQFSCCGCVLLVFCSAVVSQISWQTCLPPAGRTWLCGSNG